MAKPNEIKLLTFCIALAYSVAHVFRSGDPKAVDSFEGAGKFMRRAEETGNVPDMKRD